ncbi:flavin reductase family protein [Ideonella azotifigens]|uniref:flavin reductase family protein n=1 Tax=Ideonella azotifigens TaxID=513160 RepID=UPI0035C16A85
MAGSWHRKHDRQGLDKFEHFGLTAQSADDVDAPLIGEAYANFECKLHDGSKVGSFNLFIWEIVKAHVAANPAHPETVHHFWPKPRCASPGWRCIAGLSAAVLLAVSFSFSGAPAIGQSVRQLPAAAWLADVPSVD